MKLKMFSLVLMGLVVGVVPGFTATEPTAGDGPLIVEPDGRPGPRCLFWLQSSLQRIFPNSLPGSPTLELLSPRSDVEYGRQGLTDLPIPAIFAAEAFREAKIPHWVYFCCAPRGPYLQRLLDTPLPKIRMAGLCPLANRGAGPKRSVVGKLEKLC